MFRQLDQRDSNCATVTLEWNPVTHGIQVRYEDHRSPSENFTYSVNPPDARLAFLHPFVLRPSGHTGDAPEGSPDPGQTAETKPRRRWFQKRSRAEPAQPSGNYSWLWWPPEAGGTADHQSQ